MAEEIIMVGYKVEIVVGIDNGFEEKEIDDIRKIVSKEIAEMEGETWKYFKRNVNLLKHELVSTSKWPREQVDRIRIKEIRVEQI